MTEEETRIEELVDCITVLSRTIYIYYWAGVLKNKKVKEEECQCFFCEM